MRKKKEEEGVMWDEYMEQRKQARLKEEEDLKKLKERQVSSGICKESILEPRIILTPSRDVISNQNHSNAAKPKEWSTKRSCKR